MATRRIKVKRGHMGLYEESLFGVKAGHYGTTRSAHGAKVRINFHQLVFDTKTNRARVARRRKVWL